MVEHDPRVRDAQTWEDFAEKGLCPEIKSLPDYRERFQRNWEVVETFLEQRRKPITKMSEFQGLHRTLFQGIYPWAGELRDHNIMCRGRAGAPPENIAGELEMLETQMEVLLEGARSKIALFRIAVFQHARLTTIQAFGDGNSRSSRAVTDHFLTLVTGRPRSKGMIREEYFECLEEALGKENLAPLTKLLQGCYNEAPSKSKWIPSPFRTTNFPTEVVMPRAIGESFRQDPAILEEDFPRKLIWNRKVSWDSALQIIGGKPTDRVEIARRKWEEQQRVACEWKEFQQFLKELEKLGPTKKVLLSRENPRMGWRELEEKLEPPKNGRTNEVT